ncbi:STAS/SEC14 domain-containing protein [Pokkaliibacter sp. MBI-7]|uniref:STAS/SEC14 domain-containing protein n=1 Tax=Pokkaliibacter sp. MBI-7 TaxID=3040600 RepID=UPI0024474FA3|nr:STAS/SEC14 domain-containing protein [Pokkaliibacter sp. MBI-7]MDH2432592.1 STAS/SEC14 domain-containing protein [Pokkaliibacter sp. MBI-7]
MTIARHGLSIGIERFGEEFFLSLKAVGKLTHADYEVISPMVDSALAQVPSPRVKALFDATELLGWELRAAWDDLRLGLKHGSEFEKVAIYGNRHWQEVAAKIGSWFVGGEVRYFENLQQALSWLQQD